MKASFLAENLKLALSLLKATVPGVKIQFPILRNVQIKTDDKRLLLMTTNLEVTTKVWIGAKVDEHGATTLPFVGLGNLAKLCKKGQIDMTLADKTQVSSFAAGAVKTDISGIDAQEYPVIPTVESDWYVTLDAQELLLAINTVKHAAATDTERPILNSVLLEFSDRSSRVVGADGFRLAIRSIRFMSSLPAQTVKDGEKPKPVRVVVPLAAVASLVKVLPYAKDLVTLVVKTNANKSTDIAFKTASWEVVAHVDEMRYPDFDAIVPKLTDQYLSAVVDSGELLSAAKTCLPIAKPYANIVRISATILTDIQSLTLWAKNDEMTTDVTVLAQATGLPRMFAVNCAYLVQALEALPKCKIRVSQLHSSSPILITDFGTVTMVLMPMNLTKDAASARPAKIPDSDNA